jgi:hypothetical protein
MNNNYKQLDLIQMHILGLIVNLISWYSLPIDSVKEYYVDHLKSTESNELNESNDIEMQDDKNSIELNNDESMLDEPTISKIWIQTRRDFRDKLDDGLKICPNYYECHNDECDYFHVKKEFICNHAIDNNYCNDFSCTKIIIKKCRKGNKCKDNKCSFRHINREK